MTQQKPIISTSDMPPIIKNFVPGQNYLTKLIPLYVKLCAESNGKKIRSIRPISFLNLLTQFLENSYLKIKTTGNRKQSKPADSKTK